ncbi:hypothetical protein NLJ89_g318 [Agrocybe chaxingu]|uniref:Uncharacterized protein n=1 Tax=Agrocybe chaxingu TaxID=84603 RepID=A0A9W8TF44_9AGAR|nr:hypothetical protein NLJ89_g318 [Agrocybe chaxingu]
MPSWPTEPTTRWSKPDLPETSLWGSDASAGWNPAPSTFDRISLTKDVMPEFEPPFNVKSTLQEATDDDGTTLTATHSSPVVAPEDDQPPVAPPVEPLNPPPESPKPPPLTLPTVEDTDGFGTFETATDADESDDWDTPSKPNFSLPSADTAAWGAAWGAPTSATSEAAERTDVADAWESARREKEKQDRHVPPELLASILLQLEEISNDLWKGTEAGSGGELENQRNPDFDSLGLNPAVQRLVPDDLTLPMNPPFSKTFTSKQLSDALKFTRHAPLTPSSPFAMFMTSKGSTSWEAAIKAKPNITQDDVTPAGWKIVETVKQEATNVEDGKKKTGGGLLSFFGRRATTSSADSSRRSASPGSVSVKAGTSPRASVDSSRSNPTHSVGRSTPASPIVPSFGSIKSERAATPPVSATSTVSVTSTISATSKALEEITRQPTPPPSAVSRFLGRFSTRPKSSSHESLSLSDNDLEFLSDVPTLQNESEKGPDLDALSTMIKSPPLPATLPPPLPPPPSKPSTLFRQPVQTTKPPSNDLFSIFDSPKPTPTPSGHPLPSMTSVSVSAVKPPLHTKSGSTSTSLQPPPPISSTPPILPIQQSFQDSNDDWGSFDYPSPPMTKAVAPQPKRAFVPIMNSSRSSSASPSPKPQPLSAFTLPPPPSVQQTLRSKTSATVGEFSTATLPLPLPLPTNSRPQPPPPPKPTQTTLSVVQEDDDFADFLSSPADAAPSTQQSFGDFATVSLNVAGPSTTQLQTSGAASFDDWDDFLSPQPPQPPTKPAHPPSVTKTFPNATKASPPLQPQSTHSRKPSRKADHSRTLSLLETAAARGRWLAPPSPLPNALPAPPSGVSAKSSTLDFFDLGSTMQSQQAQAVAKMSSSHSSPAAITAKVWQPPTGWAFPPPPSSNGPLLQPTVPPPSQPSLFASPIPPQSSIRSASVSPAAPAVSMGSQTGGLSAQDLSFFEGL